MAKLARGIALGVGNPQQVISLRPSAKDDNTWLFNSADCINSSNDSRSGLKEEYPFFKDHTLVPLRSKPTGMAPTTVRRPVAPTYSSPTRYASAAMALRLDFHSLWINEGVVSFHSYLTASYHIDFCRHSEWFGHRTWLYMPCCHSGFRLRSFQGMGTVGWQPICRTAS